jgi:V/A-type H+-transporting ATPase subunit I
MVVPMKKVSLLVMDKNKKASLEKLRELGVVHLEKKTGSSKALTKVLDRYTQIEIASGILTAYIPKKPKKGSKKEEAPKFEGDLAGRVVALSERRKKLLDYMFNHQREMKKEEKWGEF